MKALVLGGTKGIGLEITERLRKNGHAAAPMARSLAGITGLCKWVDLTWPQDQIEQSTHEAIEDLGGLDWLVLSAGMGAYTGPWSIPREIRYKIMQTNYHGRVEVFMAAKRALIRSRGKCLWIGSSVGRLGARFLQDYAAAMEAGKGWVRCAAREMAHHHVAVNYLETGWVDTPMTAEIKPELRVAIERSIPVKRMARAEEVAEVAVAALDHPHFFTGAILPMTGGA